MCLGSALAAWLLTTPALAPQGLIRILIGSCINAYTLIYIQPLPPPPCAFPYLSDYSFAGYNSNAALFKISKNSWLWHAGNMASITVTFKERQKQRLDIFPHQYGDAALIFEKPLLGFIAFIGSAVARSDGFIRDRCTAMSTRSFLMSSWQKHSLRNNSQCNTQRHQCEILNLPYWLHNS